MPANVQAWLPSPELADRAHVLEVGCGSGRAVNVMARAFPRSRFVGYDLLPTFCELAGVSADAIPKQVEGGSFAALLRNQGQGEVKRPRPELVFHFPHYQVVLYSSWYKWKFHHCST